MPIVLLIFSFPFPIKLLGYLDYLHRISLSLGFFFDYFSNLLLIRMLFLVQWIISNTFYVLFYNIKYYLIFQIVIGIWKVSSDF